MKKCNKCGLEKDLTCFHKDKSKKDGLVTQCKECVSKRSKSYYLENKEKINKYVREYCKKKENKKRIAEQMSQFYQKNREELLRRATLYREENKEKIVIEQKIYREKNKEKLAEKSKDYYIANREQIKKKTMDRYYKKSQQEPNCVYEIRNKTNNKVYIGQTTRGRIRWTQHLTELRGNYHKNKVLQEDFDKFGEEAFEWTILKEFESEDKDILLLEEARSIRQYTNEGAELYNLALTIEQLKMLTEDK